MRALAVIIFIALFLAALSVLALSDQLLRLLKLLKFVPDLIGINLSISLSAESLTYFVYIIQFFNQLMGEIKVGKVNILV